MSTDKSADAKKYKGSYGIWRIVYLVILGLSAAGIIVALFFIYQNIYATSLNTSAIVEMRSDISWFSLDLRGYEEAQDLLAQKSKLRQTPFQIKNIFIYNAAASAAGTAVYASSTSENN